MRTTQPLALSLLILFLGSCCDRAATGHAPDVGAPQDPAIPVLGLFALKSSNGQYVSCAMTPASAGHVLLYANKATVGPNEVFTAQYTDNGRFGIKAPNGKFVTVERNFGSILSADRDYVGDWETFELVDAGQGRSAFKNSNSQFVGAHHELPAPTASQLLADKPEAHDWEFFTVERDPAIGQ